MFKRFINTIGSLLCLMMIGLPGLAAPANEARGSITTNDLLRHVTVLSSDEFEGRAPATRGEELTVKYLADQLRSYGVQPGNPDGSYVQQVPLMGVTSDITAKLRSGGASSASPVELSQPAEAVLSCLRFEPEIAVTNSELVFVGYGVVAPEYNWDDFKAVDVRGKTLVFLVNDPSVADANDPAQLDPGIFKG